MIAKYDQLWPKHPFVFRIPFQQLDVSESEHHEGVRTSPDIKGTVLGLLRDIPDDEWIYWCIDDKYPICLNISAIEGIMGWLPSTSPGDIDGILLCRCRTFNRPDFVSAGFIADNQGVRYLERADYEQIWIHQFLRVKVLRFLFESFPDEISSAKLMDEMKRRIVKPDSHRIYVVENNLAVFGESTTRGVLTKNCYRSMRRCGLALPEWYTVCSGKTKIMGKLGLICRIRAWYERISG